MAFKSLDARPGHVFPDVTAAPPPRNLRLITYAERARGRRRCRHVFGPGGRNPTISALYAISFKSPAKRFSQNTMQRPSTTLGELESRLLSWAQMTDTICATSPQIGSELRLSKMQRGKLLDRMTRRGLIVQLQKGLYLLPEKLPPGGRWQPAVEVALWYFLQARKANWQETGPAAFNHYRLTEQIPNVATVYNDKVSGRRRFGKLAVSFIKVSPARLGNTRELELAPGKSERRRIGTLARVVFDAVYDYNSFGTLPKAYTWISQRKTDAAFLNELSECSLRYGNVATRRRIGWLLENIDAPAQTWKALSRSLKESSAFIPLDTTKPARGHTNRTWGVIENLDTRTTDDDRG